MDLYYCPRENCKTDRKAMPASFSYRANIAGHHQSAVNEGMRSSQDGIASWLSSSLPAMAVVP